MSSQIILYPTGDHDDEQLDHHFWTVNVILGSESKRIQSSCSEYGGLVVQHRETCQTIHNWFNLP